MNSLWILLFASLCTLIKSVYIEDNGYQDVTISFSENVLKEAGFDFIKMKNILTNASDILFHATKKRSYFKNFLLVVPSTWAEKGICDEFVTKSPKNIDIYVTDSPDISFITTQHSKGCGKKGEIIYLPKEWITSSKELSLQFVQQWSTFRYGVFPENPERNGSCIASPDFEWSPTGCYNIDLDVKNQFDENGLPVCDLPNDFGDEENLRSSLMFSAANSSKMLNFCDGESFPHNPIAPTLHNRICDGNSVWSIIENTEDFKYGRNAPFTGANSPNKPTFRCYKESKSHLTIMIQETDSEARSEIRYALVYFLSIIEPADFAVSLATFSSNKGTDDKDFTDIDLENEKNFKSLLESRVKLNEEIPDVCLSCGFRKAYKVSKTSPYTTRTIILIARESSLHNIKFSELTKIMEKDANTVLYILFLEDTANDIIPSSLVEATQGTGGRIFRLKNEPVLMLTELTTALLDASKNVLQNGDTILVVHKKTYVNVTSDISDVFTIPKNTKGKLLYSMQFKKRGEFKYDECEDMDKDLQSPICGNQTELDDGEEAKVWRYSFHYIAGSKGTTCSSLALLKLESPTKNLFTVKGWLNDNKIIPGQNALVIYAEVYNKLNYDVKVDARISGPGFEDFQLELRDNGNGDPDVIKGDNIYSRYFTTFSEKGTYTVSIIAEALVSENSNMTVKENFTANEMKVTQTKTIGTFRVIQSPPKEDILPPNRVCDLKIIRVDSTNKTILLQWTAPGDDYDYGKAKIYTIKISNNWMAMMDSFKLKKNILLEFEEHEPANSGVTENIPVWCPKCKIDTIYYIALQATDNKYNKGKVSNIVQVYFNGIDIFSTGSDKIFTETTIALTEITASIGVTTIVEENTTANYTKDGIFIEKNTFIIAASSLGAFILIIIIINIIICYCCSKKEHSDKPKKLSKKASMQPPHNLNITYKQGSESSLNDEQVNSNSLSTLVDQSYDERGSLDKRYTYHTDKSLRSKMESESKRNNLGFKPVKPMPAYASSSLSRFVARQRDIDNDLVSQANTVELSNLDTDDTRIYPLGQV